MSDQGGEPLHPDRETHGIAPYTHTAVFHTARSGVFSTKGGGDPRPARPGDPRASALSLSTSSRPLEDGQFGPSCGTWAGYKRHRRAGEDACEPCAEACRRQARERYWRNPEPKRAKARERYRESVRQPGGEA